jgi:MFS family permease
MPGVASMVMLGALVVALFEAINALLPVYVRDVLNADPVMSIFIFAPAGIGFLLGTILTPPLIRMLGERAVAAISFFLIASGAVLLGSIHEVADRLGPYSPLRVVEPFGVSLSSAILAAGVIVIPTNLGSTLAAGTVQAFINKFVPLDRQGRTFGMQEVLEQAVTVSVLLALGGMSSLIGARLVYLIAPLMVVTFGVVFVRFSYRSVGHNPPAPFAATQALVTGRGLGDPEPLMDGGHATLTNYDPKPNLPAVPRPTVMQALAVPNVPAKPPRAKKVTRKGQEGSVRGTLMTRTRPKQAPPAPTANKIAATASEKPPKPLPKASPPPASTQPRSATKATSTDDDPVKKSPAAAEKPRRRPPE